MAAELLDRFRGCMLGVAVGDALGMPVEGLTRDEIAESLGEVREMIAPERDHFHCGLSPGQYTDDTEQTLLLAETIIEAGFFDVEGSPQSSPTGGDAGLLTLQRTGASDGQAGRRSRSC